MNAVPAGWYDDPEDPTQYRYWNGTAWEDHRAPKTTPSSPSTDGGSLISEGWGLFWSNWAAMLVIGVVTFVALIVLFAVVAIQASSALDPGIITIFERITEPGFNPETNASDQAFVDSITFDPSLTFWVTVVVGTILSFVIQGLAFGVAQVHLAASAAGRPFSLTESLRVSLARFPRWVAVSILWGLVYGVAMFATIFVIILLVAVAPAVLVILIPALIAAAIYAYPFVWFAPTALIIGPTDRPPFRSVVQLVKQYGWRKIAVPLLLANLVLAGINIALGMIGIVPILGQIISFAGQTVAYALGAALAIPLWRTLGGEVGDDIDGGAPSEASPLS